LFVNGLLFGNSLIVFFLSGAEPANKEVRTQLFEASGKRTYPQVFLKEADGSYTNVGDFEEVQSLNDTDTLPQDVLDANPTVLYAFIMHAALELVCAAAILGAVRYGHMLNVWGGTVMNSDTLEHSLNYPLLV